MKPKCLVRSSIELMAALLLLLVPLFSALAQTPQTNWEKVAPNGEEFTALMPGKPEVSTEKAPYGQITVSTTYYAVSTTDGPLFMIGSVSGLESFLAMVPGKDRMTSATEGFQKSFLQEARSNGLKAEMTFARDLKLNGHLGKEFNIIMGEVTGLARLYSTDRKLYAVIVLNALKGDKRVEQFLDSFTLKAATVTLETNAAPPKYVDGPAEVIKPIDDEGKADSNSKPRPKAPIRGGVLNGKAISIPKPSYPAEAREARVSGTVSVQITIDENGDVVSARAISGHPLLHDAAVAAAMGAKFTPTKLDGQPVKVSGTVTYNFVAR